MCSQKKIEVVNSVNYGHLMQQDKRTASISISDSLLFFSFFASNRHLVYCRTSREVRASLFDRGWDFQGSHLDWKTWENGKAFSSQGKVGENLTKYWKSQGISDKCYLLFLAIFKLTVYYLLKWIKFLV